MNWAFEAAQEIAARCSEGNVAGRQVQDVIVKHCPFKVDVAYMPVPRCESCAHATPYEEHAIWCDALSDGANMLFTKGFGCILWEAK